MAVTKNILPVAGYQVWTSAKASDGDVLGVYESLGQRGAKSVTVAASGADVTVRFNVVKQITKDHGADHNPWFLHGIHKSSPLVVSEYEDAAAHDVVVAADTSLVLSAQDLTVSDIKVVAGIANARITAT